MTINADIARESARRTDGKFGPQDHPEIDGVDIAAADVWYPRSTFIQDITDGYTETAVWADAEEGTESDELDAESLDAAKIACQRFAYKCVDAGIDVTALEGVTAWDLGNNFWLTRQGHGTGFWDTCVLPTLDEDTRDKLDEISRSFGEGGVYTTDDGLLAIYDESTNREGELAL